MIKTDTQPGVEGKHAAEVITGFVIIAAKNAGSCGHIELWFLAQNKRQGSFPRWAQAGTRQDECCGMQ